MDWKQSLGRNKFYSIYTAAMLETIVGILSSLIDTAVVGHLIGTIGLSAMNIIAPVTGITIFTEGVFSIGTSMVYSEYKGKYQQDKADRAFGTGIVCSVAIGLLTTLALICIVPHYLNYMGVSEEIRKLIYGFFFFIYPQLAIMPFYQLICQMVITDGGEVLGTAANVADTVLNLVLSIILGRSMGIMGIGLGTLISTLVALAIALVHFLDKRNSLRMRPSFVPGDMKKSFLFGVSDCIMFFLMPVLSFVLTKFVILRFGEYHLPVLTIIYSIFEITVVFDATGEAMRPIMPIYMGDSNNGAVKNLLLDSLKVNMAASVVFALLLFFAGPYIPIAFDITDPVLLKECSYALRIYALACPGRALVADFISFYFNTGRKLLSASVSVISDLISVLILSIIMGLCLGLRGMLLGFVLAPYLTALIVFGYIFFRYGKDRFPTLLSSSGDIHLNRVIRIEEKEIMSLVYEVHSFLEANDTEKKLRTRIEVLMEELLLLIMEKNRGSGEGKKEEKVMAECCIRISGEGIDISIWDSGKIFNAMEEEGNLAGFRSYFVERVLSRQKKKKHIVATSYNKNYCHFDFDEALKKDGV